MRGLGTASSALTIVNALPTGIGCALGIALTATAEVELSSSAIEARPSLRVAEGERTALVETATRRALARCLPGRAVDVELRVRSEIPPARGLKRSSAVASASVAAIDRATDAELPAEERAVLSAEIGREAGVSATGALDDAYAGLSPGFCLTDNRQSRLLAVTPPGPDWEAAILLPPGEHRPSPTWAERFSREVSASARAVERARAGDFWSAMELNSELVERVMGYDYAALRLELRVEGALGAGVSGLGPALVTVAPGPRMPRLLAVLERHPGQRLRVPVTRAESPAPRGAA